MTDLNSTQEAFTQLCERKYGDDYKIAAYIATLLWPIDVGIIIYVLRMIRGGRNV